MILVTGGAGYVGSHCVKELSRQGYEVVVLDNLSQGHREAVLTEHFVQGDLLDLGALRKMFKEHSIDAVMHFAALANVADSVNDPQKYYHNNIIGTLNLLQVMLEQGVSQIVFSSSAAVYGDPEVVPIPEDTSKYPKNPYGKTKWITEQILDDYAAAYGLRYIALRYFNAAGCDPDGALGEAHHPETHLIPIVLDVALGKRDHVVIFGTDYPTSDGTCIRDYVHVSDLAIAHVFALQALNVEHLSTNYNLGIGRGYSVREIIKTCEEVAGTGIKVVEGARRPGDPAVLVADPARAKGELLWKPKHQDLREIIESAWMWRKKHTKGYAT